MIDTPWVADAMRHYLKSIFCRMISPDASIDLFPFAIQQVFKVLRKRIIVCLNTLHAGLGLSDDGMGKNALQSVEPSIRAPVQAVYGFMAVIDSPAGQ